VSLRLLRARDAVGAVEPRGETEEVSATVPIKLFTLAIVTVDVCEEPAGMVIEPGTDDSVKSTTFSGSVSKAATPPLSVTVTLTK